MFGAIDPIWMHYKLDEKNVAIKNLTECLREIVLNKIWDRYGHCKNFNLKINPPNLPRHPNCDLEFISRANPQVILVLIQEIEELQAERLKLQNEVQHLNNRWSDYWMGL